MAKKVKKSCRRGMLCRRAVNNIPIGPWRMISSADAKWVYVHTIEGCKNSFDILLRKNVWVPTVKSLCISHEKIENIRRKGEIVISHDATDKWVDVYYNRPDVIRFYSCTRSTAVHCTLDGVRYDCNYGKRRITIIIDRVIL